MDSEKEVIVVKNTKNTKEIIRKSPEVAPLDGPCLSGMYNVQPQHTLHCLLGSSFSIFSIEIKW